MNGYSYKQINPRMAKMGLDDHIIMPSEDPNVESDCNLEMNLIVEHESTAIKNLLLENNESGLDFPMIQEGERYKFLKDPKDWMEKCSLHQQKFTEDEHYLSYIVGLLEKIVESEPFGSDNHIYSPLLLLQKLVSVKMLKQREDPMRTALRLSFRLNEYSQLENDHNSFYDRKIEELQKIPEKFALYLMEACITPAEVDKLMSLDDETMFQDVLRSGNKRLIASKFYQKLVSRTFWGTDDRSRQNNQKDSFVVKVWRALRKTKLSFLLWNIFYFPSLLVVPCLKPAQRNQFNREMKKFFVPFSCYLADLLNYFIMIVLLLMVTLSTVPDPRPVQSMISEFLNSSEPLEDPRFRQMEDGTFEVRLPPPIISPLELTLWACIFSRILSEWFQAFQQQGTTTKDK